MPIVYFFIGILISIGLITADWALSPSFQKHSLSLSTPSISATPTPTAFIPASPIPLLQAATNSFPNITTQEFPQTDLLFGKFSILLSEQKILFYKKTFFSDASPIFTIYSYTSPQVLEPFSSSIENSLLQSSFSPTPQILNIQRYGGKSFAIRLEQQQKTMYIVIVFGDRLLGIEYSLDDILRHKGIDAMLQSAFPYQGGN